MFNYYLFESSYSGADKQELEHSFNELNTVCILESKSDEDYFYSSEIWKVQTGLGVFHEIIYSRLDDQLSQLIIPRLLRLFKNIDPILDIDDFDSKYQIYNAFWGINNRGVPHDKFIRNKREYLEFRIRNLWDIDHNTFWSRRERLFPNIKFCDCVEKQISQMGGSKHFSQVIKKLKEFNKAISEWRSGRFDYRHLTKSYSLNISPESARTMEKYGEDRLFTLPDGSSQYFELHIKTGDLRFHFYPNDDSREVYIGYIGKHLPTISDK